jgi:hypothetical protein
MEAAHNSRHGYVYAKYLVDRRERMWCCRRWANKLPSESCFPLFLYMRWDVFESNLFYLFYCVFTREIGLFQVWVNISSSVLFWARIISQIKIIIFLSFWTEPKTGLNRSCSVWFFPFQTNLNRNYFNWVFSLTIFFSGILSSSCF